jgi:branched-subunit amino acid ABC-type transport system permease component
MTEIQTLVFGLITGSYLITATLGFALVWRVEGFLNIAHAELIALGGFLAYVLNVRAGWWLPVAAVAAVIGVAITAALVARLAYWPIRQTSPAVLMITSVGVLFVLHGTIETVIKPGTYNFDAGRPAIADLELFRINGFELAIVVSALLAVLVTHLLVRRTQAGLLWRARANDEGLARARGVRIGTSSTMLWLLAGALAGLSGVLLGLQGPLHTDIAFTQLLLILSVAILAGRENIYGVVVAALLLGVAMDLSTLVIPGGYRSAIAFGVVLLALILRPQGLTSAAGARYSS